MHILPALLAVLPAAMIRPAMATPTDDMQLLRISCESGAQVLDASLNNSAPMNTSNIVQDVTWQIGASFANLQETNSTSPTTSNNTILLNSTNTAALDTPYFDYIDSILTLTESTRRRGLTVHTETNAPVLSALQSLASAVQTYGMRLANSGLISRDAIIRTFTAGNAVVDAQGTWARNATVVLWGGVRRSRVRRA